MQIASQSLSLTSLSQYYQKEEESLTMSAPAISPKDFVQGSQGSLSVGAIDYEDSLDGLDPKYRVMALLLEALTGQKVTTTNFHTKATTGSSPSSNSSTPTQSNSPIFEYKYHMKELSKMNFSAEGKVTLTDGSPREFSLSIEWAQSFSESQQLRIQDGQIFNDPLVISFGGEQPLSTNAFAFNLTGKEGQTIPYLLGNAGYLALDKDGDGAITKGSELFGPQTGKGFMELSAYDNDKNGWIDSGDTIFKQLKIWTVSESSDTLLSLKEAGIGAVSLKTASLDYTLKSDASTPVANFKNVSVALGEKAGVYGVFEVDIASQNKSGSHLITNA